VKVGVHSLLKLKGAKLFEDLEVAPWSAGGQQIDINS
jgi:hypothetical protein